MANSHTHAHSRSLIHSHAQKIVILLIKKNCKIYQERQRMAGYHTHHTAIQPHVCIWANVCVCVGIALANGTQQPPWNLNWRDSVAPSDHFVCELNTSFAIRIILYVLVCEDHIFACVCLWAVGAFHCASVFMLFAQCWKDKMSRSCDNMEPLCDSIHEYVCMCICKYLSFLHHSVA